MKILLVDDEAIALEAIKANIDFSDYGINEVATANSMEQAKQIIYQGGVSILLCDIEMPSGSGLDLIKWVNANAPEIVTLILSCHTEFQFAQAAVGLSCQQYITKPATPDVLSKAISKAVEQVAQRSSDFKIRQLGQEYFNQIAGIKGDEISAAEQVKKYIVTHIDEDLSVEELSKMVFMSQNQLARLFKKEYGKTVVEYIMDYRISLAEEMLKNTDLTVTTVSAKVGYPNYAYFTKLFKKYSGYTPSSFRNKFQNRNNDDSLWVN